MQRSRISLKGVGVAMAVVLLATAGPTGMHSNAYGAEVANKVHSELKRLGGVRPPREFVLMDRAAIGLGSVFMHLKAEVNWHRLFQGLIGDFDVKTLEKRQTDALKKAGVPAAH